MAHSQFPTLTVVEHPLIKHNLTIMRAKQTPPEVFRERLRYITRLLAFQAFDHLELAPVGIETPMGPMDGQQLAGKAPTLISILRAGNGMLDGMLDICPSARVGFVGLARNEETLQPEEYYYKVPPNIDQRKSVVVDPMLATGGSAIDAVAKIKETGAKDIRFVCLVAAPEGVAAFAGAHPDVEIFTAALDQKLNEIGYIVPGLGDAGDRIFGTTDDD